MLMRVDFPRPVWPAIEGEEVRLVGDAIESSGHAIAVQGPQASKGGGARRDKHTNTNDVELETTLQELALDLAGDAVETNMALGVDGRRGSGRHCRWWFEKKNRIELRGRWCELIKTNGCQVDKRRGRRCRGYRRMEGIKQPQRDG